MRPTFIIAGAFAVLPILSGPAWAQANRTFVSGHGSDSNPCSLSDPCRSFAGALAQTNAGGEITVLDSAGYGTVTINKSITITNPGGVEAGITTTSGESAIQITSSTQTEITLRGLTLEGGNVGNFGVTYASSVQGTLNIIDCVVKDFVGTGIAISPTASGPGQVINKIVISHSYVLNNGMSGIEINPLNQFADIDFNIEHSTITGNGTSGNDAGILVNASDGFVGGTISSVHAEQNNIGVNIFGVAFGGSTIVSNSAMTNK